jgi:hypothetical protein
MAYISVQSFLHSADKLPEYLLLTFLRSAQRNLKSITLSGASVALTSISLIAVMLLLFMGES